MRLLLIIAATLVVMEALAAAIRSRKKWGTKPFESSGCNVVPEGNWGECCVEHDKAYRTGGWAVARLKADCALFMCVLRNRNPFAAVLYFVGVRFAGMWAFQYGKKRELFYQTKEQQ